VSQCRSARDVPGHRRPTPGVEATETVAEIGGPQPDPSRASKRGEQGCYRQPPHAARRDLRGPCLGESGRKVSVANFGLRGGNHRSRPVGGA
jgi:hypothetical protein